MDDSISGSQNLQEGYNFYLYNKIFMQEGGFTLRKWATNYVELRRQIEENEKLLGEPDVGGGSVQKCVLGVMWNTESDMLEMSFQNLVKIGLDNEVVTKRFVLKVISSVFDPLGVLGAFVINLKLLFQELCFMKCAWDDELEVKFCEKWK